MLFGWVWEFLQLPQPQTKSVKVLKWVSVVASVGTVISFLWRMTNWQNSLRFLMEMNPVESAYPLRTFAVALLVGLIVVLLARCVRFLFNAVAKMLSRILPQRLAYIASVTVVSLLCLSLLTNIVAKRILDVLDAAHLQADIMTDDGVEQPMDSWATGSPDSLVSWSAIGRRGKNFITGGPTRKQIAEFWKVDSNSDNSVKQPLRVYVGVRGSSSPEARAKLALEELKRVGGFDRKLLVVATPTGTGWLDTNAVNPFEFLHAGDTAIVSTQYSYLSSWLTILVDPDRSKVSAQALFLEIYDYWTTLPKDKRPKLYLHGLSLGSLGAEVSADLLMTFEDPIQGAVFSGPPFPSQIWSSVSKARNEGTPEWLPKFRDGAAIRFTSQTNSLEHGKRWGPMRLVYVQYASDPIVWFSKDMLFEKPDWLQAGHGPDVSPHLEWYPIVTFLQVACDLPVASTAIPTGYGHNYSASSYIDAWIEVTEPANWSKEKTARLKELFAPQPANP